VLWRSVNDEWRRKLKMIGMAGSRGVTIAREWDGGNRCLIIPWMVTHMLGEKPVNGHRCIDLGLLSIAEKVYPENPRREVQVYSLS
jgi:hypothetical protein